LKALRRLALLPAALVAGGSHAAAQCVMCGIAAEAADPETASRTLATAILVLLLPALGVLAGVGLLLWRYRGDRTA
jgi:hypothetical protein